VSLVCVVERRNDLEGALRVTARWKLCKVRVRRHGGSIVVLDGDRSRTDGLDLGSGCIVSGLERAAYVVVSLRHWNGDVHVRDELVAHFDPMNVSRAEQILLCSAEATRGAETMKEGVVKDILSTSFYPFRAYDGWLFVVGTEIDWSKRNLALSDFVYLRWSQRDISGSSSRGIIS
jgi:hypothetical protein